MGWKKSSVRRARAAAAARRCSTTKSGQVAKHGSSRHSSIPGVVRVGTDRFTFCLWEAQSGERAVERPIRCGAVATSPSRQQARLLAPEAVRYTRQRRVSRSPWTPAAHLGRQHRAKVAHRGRRGATSAACATRRCQNELVRDRWRRAGCLRQPQRAPTSLQDSQRHTHPLAGRRRAATILIFKAASWRVRERKPYTKRTCVEGARPTFPYFD